jgi:lysozyme family protein
MSKQAAEMIQQTLIHEGGWCNLTGDKGGETAFGIARVFHPYWKGWGRVDKLKKQIGVKDGVQWNAKLTSALRKDKSFMDCVKMFYWENMFMRLSLNKVTSDKIAREIFDSFVNCGSHAVRWLQWILNGMNYNKKAKEPFDDDLVVDGLIGMKTIRMLHAVIDNVRYNVKNTEDVILNKLNAFQSVHYTMLAQKESQRKFNIGGWENRIEYIKE